jgi:hypothetical protein
MTTTRSSSNEGGGGGRVVLEGGRNLLLGLIVASKPVDPRLDQDKTELGVLVLPVVLEVLADGDRLFNEVPEVLRDGWAKSYPQIKGIVSKIRKQDEQEKEVPDRA